MADNSRELEILLKAKNLTEEAFRAVERASEQLQDRTKKNASGFGELRKQINDFAKEHEESFKAIGKGLAIAGAGVAAVTGAIVALGIKGSTVLSVEKSFNALARSVGDTGDEILKVTRTATKGLISDMDIMSAVNKGILLGLPLTSKEMGTLSQTAVVLGKAMREGPTEALSDLIVGLGRGSPLILDNLGITLDATEAYKAYAASVGRSADSLSDAEKKIAVYRAALDAAKKKVEELGGLSLTFADRIQQGRVAVDNTVDALGKMVATSPAVNAALDVINSAALEAFGEHQAENVRTWSGYINKAAIFLVDMGSAGVSTAKFLVDAFYGVRYLLFSLLEHVTNVVYAFLDGNARIAEFLAKVPVIGAAWKSTATDARAAADMVNAVSMSFEDTKNQAAASMSASDRMFDSMNAGLGTLRAAMVKAAAEAKPVEAGFDNIGAGAKRAGAAAAETSKQIEAWTKKAGELNEALVAARKHQVDGTTILEQYGNAIEDVVREGQVFGRVIPKAIQDAYAALNGKKLAEAQREWASILNQIAIKSSEIARKQIDEQMKVAGQTGASLANAFAMRRQYEEKTLDLVRTESEKRLAAIERERVEAIEKLGKPPIGMDAQWRESTAAVNAYYDALVKNLGDRSGEVVGQITGVANLLADAFGGIFGSLLSSAMATINQIVAQSTDKFSGLAGFFNSKAGKMIGIGAQGFGAGYGAGAQYGRTKGALAGGLSGAMTGMQAGAAIGAAGGPIGMVGGMVIGGIAGVVGGLFGGGKKAKQDREELKGIREDLIATYGSFENLQKVASSVGLSMDKAFSAKKPEEAKKQIDALNKALEAQQKRLEGLATAGEALNKRASSAFGGGLVDLISERNKVAAERLSKLQSGEIDDTAAAGTEKGDKFRELDNRLTKLNEQLKSVGATGAGEFSRLGTYAGAIFAGAVKETGDMIGALTSLEPTLSVLAAAQKEFGYESSNTLTKLLGFRELVATNKDVADSVSGLNQIMKGLGDAGITNRSLFQTFGEDAGAQIRILTERNVDLNSQMQLMQPTLQALWEGQKKYGSVTDESTAKLLAQAEEQGIVGANMQSVNEKILDVLLAIADAFGAKVPAGLGATQAAADTTFGGMKKNLDDLKGRAADAVDRIEGEFRSLRVPSIDVPYTFRATNELPEGGGYEAPEPGDPYPGYAVGGVVPFTPGGRVVRVAERETERIVSDSQLEAILGRALAAAGGSTRAGAAPSVIVKIGEKELRPMVVQFAREGLANGEISVPRRNLSERGF